MKIRSICGAAALAAALSSAGAWAAPAGAVTVCTWAGTPQAPTGTFSLSPGITNLPAPRPLKFVATGVLGGGGRCGTNTMTWRGQADAGSSCLNASFEGTVQGLPGVARFRGEGPGPDVPSLLYNRAGKLVGLENAELLTQPNLPHTVDCTTPGGFRGGWPGMFSSTVVLFDR
ncbi:MAG: hypothetical protein ACJ764_10135 [Solirubrobacteraceae bacterium]